MLLQMTLQQNDVSPRDISVNATARFNVMDELVRMFRFRIDIFMTYFDAFVMFASQLRVMYL